MSGTPYIRFFGDDWLSGTSEMSLQERGALVTIVAITAATGSAPAYDLYRLSRRFGCTKNAAKKVLNALEELGKISIENGTVINARASKEVEISQKNSEKQSEKAKSRWVKSDKKSNENTEGGNAVALPWLCQPEPEPEPKIREPKGSLSSGDDLRAAFDAYNFAASEQGWPVARVLSKARASKLRQRLKDAGGIDGWNAAIAKARASPLCNGENDRGWVLDLDFLLQQKSFTKLMEGSYDKRSKQNTKNNKFGGSAEERIRDDPALEQLSRLAQLR